MDDGSMEHRSMNDENIGIESSQCPSRFSVAVVPLPLPLDSGDSGKSRAGERGWLRFSMRVAQVCNECSDESV